MSEPIETEIHPGDLPALILRLQHLVTDGAAATTNPRKAVLLLHGASANHETFTRPGEGLAGWLAHGTEGGPSFDVWLLDWRGSSLVVDDPRNRDTLLPGEEYNFNAAAEFDICAAIDEMVSQGVTPPIAVIGHCMGSGILAEAIARGFVTDRHVDCIVLSTLGLFYETPIDSRLKSEDRVLERLIQENPPCLFVDPRLNVPAGDLRTPWPDALDELFHQWPGDRFHAGADHDTHASSDARTIANHMCDRLSFMYGMVYNHTNLAEEIHGDQPTLENKFGGIPLHMYIHAARNIRQGHATFYRRDRAGGFDNADFISEAARARFRLLSRVTLITGALNRLWHRESVDLMHEWLCRGSSEFVRRVKKQVFPTYGHQDLLWGTQAPRDIFPTIGKGLTAQAPVAASLSRH